MGRTNLEHGLSQQIREVASSVSGLERAVVGQEHDTSLGELDGAAGLKAAVGVCDHRVPLCDSLRDVAEVDEVEGVVFEGPREFGVIDLKPDVGGHPGEVRPSGFGGLGGGGGTREIGWG